MTLSRSKYLVITSDYLIPIFIIVSALILFWLTFYSKLFVVKEISCQIDYEPCANNALESELNKNLGHNIFRLDISSLRDRILSGEFTLREVNIKRILPDQLLISAQSVLPTVAVKGINDPRYLTLDNQFRLIKVTTVSPNIPVLLVSTLPPLQLGKTISEEYLPILRLVTDVSKKIIGIYEAELIGSNVVAFKYQELKVIMSTATDLVRQIGLLQAVLSDSTITAGKKEIDLRFAQPVLR